ncbi:alpha/beta fold hydrolase [Erythrobacter dokdonensis]|nr:alpha/beta fold hydrolase [Erythrobacter dokdonensis]
MSLAVGILIVPAAAKAPVPAPSDAPTIVLVHGAFMDASNWDAVREELDRLGYRTIAVTLAGRGGSASDSDTPSLEAYRDAVLAAIAGETRPVVLVGHSFGGITISNVAEAAPDRIAALVYLAAYLPRNGQSLQMLAGMDRDSRTAAAFVVDAERGVASIASDQRGSLFCNDCEPATAKAAGAMMVSEPLAPLAEPARLGERFARVPRFYIRTAHDLVISPAQQSRMIAATPAAGVLQLDTGHSPMLSQPGALAALLADLAAPAASAEEHQNVR